MSDSYNEEGRNVLPQDFDGVFKFTNYTNVDFVSKWDSVQYKFPANTTTPMVMNFTPVEIQNIRKKFARDLAIREYYKTDSFKNKDNPNQGYRPPLYSDNDLKPFIQRCLEPLQTGYAEVKVLERKGSVKNLSTDAKGKALSKVVDEDEQLIPEGSTMVK